MKNKLFVYGTLHDPAVQKGVWGRITDGAPDVLSGYKRSVIEIDGETYPLIVPDDSGEVEGWVIEVTDEELAKIDEYETSAYKRQLITLNSGLSAWAYVRG